MAGTCTALIKATRRRKQQMTTTTTRRENDEERQRRAWLRILDRALIDRNARAADRIQVSDFRSATLHAARIMRRLDALRGSGMALPPPQHLPAPLRGFGPFGAYYAAWCRAEK